MKVYLLEKRFCDGADSWQIYVGIYVDPSLANTVKLGIELKAEQIRQSPEPQQPRKNAGTKAWENYGIDYDSWTLYQDFRGCKITEFELIA